MSSSNASAKVDLVKNTAILALGKFSSQFITFLMLPLYTAHLDPSEFGIVDLVVTYVALLAPALTIQMEMAVFRFLIDTRTDENDDQKNRILTNAAIVAFPMLLIFTLLTVIASFFIEIPYLWMIVGIVAAAIASGLSLQSARGFGKNLNYAIASIITGVTTVSANLILILGFGLGAEGMLISLLLSYVFSTLYLVISLRLYRYIRISARDRDFRAKLLRYSAPLVPNGIAWWIINAADRSIILIVLGLNANGIYAIATRFPLIYSAVFSVFGMSWTESASVHIDSEDRDKHFSETFDGAFRFFGSIALCIIAALPFVFPLLVAPEYNEAYIYIPLMLVGALMNSIVGLYSAIYVAKKMTKQVATTSIMATVVSVVVNLALINSLGLFASAIANVVSFLSMAVYRHFDLKKHLNIKIKKSLLAFLALLYSLAMTSYYINNLYLNIATVFWVTICAYFLNKEMVKFILGKTISKFRNSKEENALNEV